MRGVRGTSGLRVERSARVEPVPRIDFVAVRRVVLAANELAALVILDSVHDTVVVVAVLAPPDVAAVVEVLDEVRLAVVIQVAHAAELPPGPLVEHLADVRLLVPVRVEELDPPARLAAPLRRDRLGTLLPLLVGGRCRRRGG